MSQRRKRVGILGAGGVACYHAEVIQALGHEVVAGVTRSPASPRWAQFKRVAPGAAFVADGDMLLHDRGVDAVVVGLSWDAIQDWLPRILATPKPALIEKPVSLESGPLATALAKSPDHLGNKRVAFNRRFYEPVRRLRERVTRGGVKSVEVTISEDIGSHVRKHGCGIVPHLLAFASCHLLDLVRHLFGPVRVERVYAYRESGEAAPFVSFHGLLITTDGVPLWLSLNANDPSPAGLRCRFADGTAWHLSPLEILTVYRGYEILPATAETNVRRYVPREVERVSVDATFKPGFKPQMEAFLSEDYAQAATLEESLDLLRLIEEIQEGSRAA